MTFPGAGAQIYRNEAGEPTGWDYPDSYDGRDFEDNERDWEEEEYWRNGGDQGEDDDRDPHPTHCCQRHGCKYGTDTACTVARIDRPGRTQVYPCERCDDDMCDDWDDAETLNAMYDLAYNRGVADTTAVAS